MAGDLLDDVLERSGLGWIRRALDVEKYRKKFWQEKTEEVYERSATPGLPPPLALTQPVLGKLSVPPAVDVVGGGRVEGPVAGISLDTPVAKGGGFPTITSGVVGREDRVRLWHGESNAPLAESQGDTSRRYGELIRREAEPTPKGLVDAQKRWGREAFLFDWKTGRLRPEAYAGIVGQFRDGAGSAAIGLDQFERTGEHFTEAGFGKHLEARVAAARAAGDPRDVVLPGAFARDPEDVLRGAQHHLRPRAGSPLGRFGVEDLTAEEIESGVVGRQLLPGVRARGDWHPEVEQREGFGPAPEFLKGGIRGARRQVLGPINPWAHPILWSGDLLGQGANVVLEAGGLPTFGGVGKAGLFDVPARFMKLVEDFADWTSERLPSRRELVSAFKAQPRLLGNLLWRAPEMPMTFLVSVRDLVVLAGRGEFGESMGGELEQLWKVAKKSWNASGEHYAHLPSRSFAQEAFELAQGLSLGLGELALRSGAAISSDRSLREMSRGFVDGAVEFATPMVRSFVETAKAPGELIFEQELPMMARKAPLEMALNLMMVKAVAKAPLLGRNMKMREVANQELVRVKGDIKELGMVLGALETDAGRLRRPPKDRSYLDFERRMGDPANPRVDPLAVKWRKGKVTPDDLTGMQRQMDGLLERHRGITKKIDGLNDAASGLVDLADAIDASGVLFGEGMFTALDMARMIVRRKLEGKLGMSAEGWIFRPRDERTVESFRLEERRLAGAARERSVAMEELARAIPEEHRPVIETFFWMEHEPFFNVNPAKNYVGWGGERWVLTEAGRKIMEARTSKTATREARAFALGLEAQLDIANRFGLGLAREFYQLSNKARGLGLMGKGRGSGRGFYFGKFYNKFDRWGRLKQMWKGKGREAKGPNNKVTSEKGSSAFMEDRLSRLGVPIEALEVGLGDDLGRVINVAEDKWIRLPESLADFDMAGLIWEPGKKSTVDRWGEGSIVPTVRLNRLDAKGLQQRVFNPKEYLRQRQKNGLGGWALDRNLVRNVVNGIEKLSYDVSMHELYRWSARNPRLSSPVPRKGFIEVTPQPLVKGSRFSPRRGRLIGGKRRPVDFDARFSRFGDLTGMYLEGNLWHEMVNMAKFMDEAPSFWRQTLRRWKTAMTAWSPTTTARNILTNVLLFAPMADISVLNPLNWTYYRRAIVDASVARHKRSQHWKEAHKDGAFEGTFHRTELIDATPALTKGLLDAKNGRELVRAFFNAAVDISTGRHKIYEVPGIFYGLGDDIFRQATHHKFKGTRGRAAATDLAQKSFIEYPAVQGFVQIVRAPFRPILHEPKTLVGKALGGSKDVRVGGRSLELSAAAGVFWSASQPFMAFTARAIPLVMDWMKNDPFRARMYLNLYDNLTRVSQGEAGHTGDSLYGDIAAMPAYQRFRYNPGGILFDWMGIEAKKRDGAFGEEVVTPVMNSAWGTPFDLFTGQFDAHSVAETWSGTELEAKMRDLADRSLFSNNPFVGPLVSLFRNKDPLSGRPIFNADDSLALSWERVASFLIRRWLPPVTPRPSDVGALVSGRIEEHWDDDLGYEHEAIKGGYFYEGLRAAARGIPNFRGEVAEMADVMFALLEGIKISRRAGSELVLRDLARFEFVMKGVLRESVPRRRPDVMSTRGDFVDVGVDVGGVAVSEAVPAKPSPWRDSGKVMERVAWFLRSVDDLRDEVISGFPVLGPLGTVELRGLSVEKLRNDAKSRIFERGRARAQELLESVPDEWHLGKQGKASRAVVFGLVEGFLSGFDSGAVGDVGYKALEEVEVGLRKEVDGWRKMKGTRSIFSMADGPERKEALARAAHFGLRHVRALRESVRGVRGRPVEAVLSAIDSVLKVVEDSDGNPEAILGAIESLRSFGRGEVESGRRYRVLMNLERVEGRFDK